MRDEPLLFFDGPFYFFVALRRPFSPPQRLVGPYVKFNGGSRLAQVFASIPFLPGAFR